MCKKIWLLSAHVGGVVNDRLGSDPTPTRLDGNYTGGQRSGQADIGELLSLFIIHKAIGEIAEERHLEVVQRVNCPTRETLQLAYHSYEDVPSR